MKRFLLILLACVCIVCLSACNNTPATPEDTLPQATEAPVTEAPVTEAPVTEVPSVTEAPVTEAPVTEVPSVTETPATEAPAAEEQVVQVYNVYVDGALTFEYPANWEVTVEGALTMLMNPEDPTSNVNVISEAKYDHATVMTEEAYSALLSALYEGVDFVIQDINIENTTNSYGTAITAIKVTASMYGVELKIGQILVSSNSKTYTISISEILSDGVIYDMIFDSVAVSNDDPEPESPATEAPQVDAPVTGEVITSYIGDISVDYPKSWGFMTDNIAQDSATGNNINVSKEAKNTYYYTLDAAAYIEQVVPIYESMGMTATNVSVEHVENGHGLDVVRIGMTMSYLGINMEMTQFVVTYGDYTYVITLTEVIPVDGLADAIFNSIRTN